MLRIDFGRHFAIQPDLGYWKRTETVSGISVSASDFSFGMTAVGLLPVRPVRFYAGAGPAVHHISGNIDSFGFVVASDTLARLVLAPDELPVGVITAVIGGSFFLKLIVGEKSRARLWGG